MRPGEWREQRNGGHIRRLGPWLAFSAMIWLLLISQLDRFIELPDPSRQVDRVDLRSLSARQWMENKSVQQAARPKAIARKQPKKTRHEEKKKPVVKRPKGQIVDIAMPEKQKIPEKADYVSQYDSSVDKQSKARKRAPAEVASPKMSRKGMKRPKQRIGRDEDRLELGPPGPPNASTKNPEPSFKMPDLKMAMKLKLDLDGDRGRFKNREAEKQNRKGNSDKLAIMFEKSALEAGNNGEGRAPNIPKSLLPDFESSVEIAGAPMNDYLKNVEQGDETWLNTRSFKYATYYNRIKRKVAQRWKPVEAQSRYDPNFAIYGYQSRYTVLSVTLDDQGNLEDADVSRSSGVDFLDQAALAAMIEAAPFPNPPSGITEQDGRIAFPFGFYFELTRSGLRMSGSKP